MKIQAKVLSIFIIILTFSVMVPSNIGSIISSSSCMNAIDYNTGFCIMDGNLPDDPYFEEQWSLHNIGQMGYEDVDIDAPEAWMIETGSEEVIIAVLDSGIDYTHPDLVKNLWFNTDEIPDNGIDDDSNGFIDDWRGYDFINDDPDPLDVHGHGTMISGVATASTNNSIGISGIAWHCKLMPLKVWEIVTDFINPNRDGVISASVNAIRYAVDNGADVISMSFGFFSFNENTISLDELTMLKEAVDYAFDNGCVLVADSGHNDESDPVYPAAWSNVICTSGTDYRDRRLNVMSIKSNYGPWVDVAVPATRIRSTMTTYDSYNSDLGVSKDYFKGSGTSITPTQVSALAALIISKNPSYSPGKIMDIIIGNVDPYDSEYDLGSGRINAYKALMEFNLAPGIPEIPSGPVSGKRGHEYSFETSSIDADNNQVFYCWDWGDGNRSDWIGPYDSGETCLVSYVWNNSGQYQIRVKGKDSNGVLSDWSDPMEITIQKSKMIHSFFFLLESLLDKISLLKKNIIDYKTELGCR